ncbi:cyclic nucleotide-binding domain-containing protein [Hyphomicrobium sp.]|uniref:cyclic nucleotide-binding domain-containing protein n=1 Tax=Hyphomicrobium sp. TaxID=82 RepID=UPI002BCEC821|nr:cyclic nucleotide-binding domain-containing protein [Hyphomicrobium sp.]HVZ04952.1 cyclic nucleotide-binding domain-containing protein [Hyphomicrobium sp.]
MATDALVKSFLSLPLFCDLKPQQLNEIARRAERIIYRPGDIIVAEDDTSDAAILIVSGICTRQAKAGDTKREELLPEGALIAELAMLIDFPHSATVIAKDQVKALRLPREKIQELMLQDADLTAHFSSHILKRVHAIAQDLLAVDNLLSRSANGNPNTQRTAQLTLETQREPHAAH